MLQQTTDSTPLLSATRYHHNLLHTQLQDAQRSASKEPETPGAPPVMPACETTYELSRAMADKTETGDGTAVAVYRLWYSLVDSLLRDSGDSGDSPKGSAPVIEPNAHLPIFRELASGKVSCCCCF
jgi:hypothetical protein